MDTADVLEIAQDVITHGTHSVNGGFLVDTEDLKKQILALQGQDGITFSGGEPFLQAEACLDIARFCKDNSLNLWCYTGFTFEQLLNSESKTALAFLNTLDVLIDGPYVEDQKDLDLDFRGSRNQRLLDVKKSLKLGRAVKLKESKDSVSRKRNSFQKLLYVYINRGYPSILFFLLKILYFFIYNCYICYYYC